MKLYSRVTYEQRCQINAFLETKFKPPEIARRLGFDKSTIYREIKRNGVFGRYSPGTANQRARCRYRLCRKKTKLTADFLNLLREKLKADWSPQQLSGRLRLEKGTAPSHVTIYKYLHGKEHRHLRTLLRKYNRRGSGRIRQRRRIREGVLKIQDRPEIANQRKRIGDWERDTMYTMNGVQLLICSDRKSRLTKIARLDQRDSYTVGQQTLNLIHETNKKAFTITNDNGGEFKKNIDIGIRTYFCDPHRPQQRGTVENSIGLLRQYVKRKTDVRNYSKEDFKNLENKVNLRPRRVLGYRTPYEVYFKKKVALAS